MGSPCLGRSAGRTILAISLLMGLGQSARGGNLFAIVATDDAAPGIGEDMEKNSKMVVSMIKRNVPRGRSQIVKVQPRALTPAAVLRTIEGLNAGADDVVFFYYSGHGAYDEARQQTYLMMSRTPGSVLFVGQVRRAIEAKRVRLATLVVDCCNNLRPVLARGPIAPGEPSDAGPPEVTPLFRRLFFEPRGSVIIESSAPREYAVVLPAMHFRDPQRGVLAFHFGSLFTQSFTGVIQNLEGDPDAAPDWAAICRQTQEGIDFRFPDLCPGGVITLGNGNKVRQEGQTVTAWIDDRPVATRK